MQPTKFHCIYQANWDDIRLSQHGIESHDRIKSIQFGLNGRARLINNSDKEFFVDIKDFLPPSYITEQQVKDLVSKHYFTASFSSGYNLKALPIGPGGGQDYSTMKNKDGTPITLTDREKKHLEDILKETWDKNKALAICASAKWTEQTMSTYNKRLEQLKILLKIGVDPNTIYEGSPVIFHTKNAEMFLKLIEAGAKWDVKNSQNESVFVHAMNIQGLETEICDAIHNAIVNGQKNLILESLQSKGDHLLAYLAYESYGCKSKYFLECVKFLVETGISLETCYGFGEYTPIGSLVCNTIFHSRETSLREAITTLCQKGANPNYESKNVANNFGTIFHRLLSESSKSKNIEDCKHAAIEIIKGKVKPDLRKKDKTGIGPLFRAKQLGWHDIFCLMIEYGADPNETHPTEGSILFSVVDPKCLECLIKAGADLTLKNSKGESIAQHIIQRPSLITIQTMDLLIQKKVDFNILDSSGNSSLFSFLKSRHPELPSLIERLLKIGIRVNDCNEKGLSPLSFFLNECIDNNDWRPATKSILSLLLDAKAEIKKIPLFIYLILPLEIKQLLQERLINDASFLTFVSDMTIKVIAGLRLSYLAIESQNKFENVKALIISNLKTCHEIAAVWDNSRSDVLSTKKKFISYLSEKLDSYLSKSIFFNPATGIIAPTVSSNFQEDINCWFAESRVNFSKIRKQKKTRLELHKIEQELLMARQSVEQADQEKKQKLVQQLEEKVKIAAAAIAKAEEDRKADQYNQRHKGL